MNATPDNPPDIKSCYRGNEQGQSPHKIRKKTNSSEPNRVDHEIRINFVDITKYLNDISVIYLKPNVLFINLLSVLLLV